MSIKQFFFGLTIVITFTGFAQKNTKEVLFTINEKPYLLIPVGYPAEECWVPDIKRKSLNEVSCWY